MIYIVEFLIGDFHWTNHEVQVGGTFFPTHSGAWAWATEQILAFDTWRKAEPHREDFWVVPEGKQDSLGPRALEAQENRHNQAYDLWFRRCPQEWASEYMKYPLIARVHKLAPALDANWGAYVGGPGE